MIVHLYKKVIIFIVMFLTLPFFVNAQTITITPNPKYPAPGDSVNFSLDGFGVDLFDANITWRKNGVVVSEGKGNIYYSDILPVGSSLYSLTAQALTKEGVISKTFQIQPFTVDLLWEVRDGYTPPFYKGKTLPVRQSNMFFMAMVSDEHPSNIAFEWSHNGQTNSFNSGFSKNTFSLINDLFYKADTVSVTAQRKGNNAEALQNITYYSPEIVFYRVDDDGSIQTNKALSNNTVLKGREVSIAAIPYYLTIPNIADTNYTMSWSVNGNVAQSAYVKNIINLRNLAKNNKTKIAVDINHNNRLYQDGTVGVNVILDLDD